MLKLSNPEFDPRVAVGTFDAPRDDPRAECTAILSVVDLTQVRNIPVDSAPAAPQPVRANDLSSFLQWAVCEFQQVFFEEPEPTPPPKSHLVHKPPQFSSFA